METAGKRYSLCLRTVSEVLIAELPIRCERPHANREILTTCPRACTRMSAILADLIQGQIIPLHRPKPAIRYVPANHSIDEPATHQPQHTPQARHSVCARRSRRGGAIACQSVRKQPAVSGQVR